MQNKNDGGPAFPHWDGPSGNCFNGMSIRDYFASKAMQVLIPLCVSDFRRDISYEEYIAKIAYKHADAMLAERSKV